MKVCQTTGMDQAGLIRSWPSQNHRPRLILSFPRLILARERHGNIRVTPTALDPLETLPSTLDTRPHQPTSAARARPAKHGLHDRAAPQPSPRG